MDAKTFDKKKLPSRHVTEGPARAPHRSYLYAMGLTSEQIHQPLVGVATAWNEAAPCNISLQRQAQAVKKGVAAARGTPREFTTITVTDGIAMGHQGMKSSLASRDVIADSVELTMRGHSYDAMVTMAGCDKSLPGMMMAMIRLNVPSIFIYGGSILPGRYKGRDIVVQDLFEAVGLHSVGKMDDLELDEMERRGLATRSEIRAMNDMLIRAGRLEDSRTFSSRHVAAGLRPLPPVIEPSAVADSVPSALDVSASEHALLHEAVELAPLRIIVVASPGCGFSRAAANAIPLDPELGPIFRKHAVWLAAPEELARIDALRSWNQDNPEAPLVVATSTDRWPTIALDSYPQFHVFRDGKLLQSVSGWPSGEGNRDAILAALRTAGVIDAPPPARSPSE